MIIPGYSLCMADQQVAVAAPEKFRIGIIRQTGLYVYIPEIMTIKLLDAVWEGDPAKIILIDGDIPDRALQQSFVHVITESIVTADGLCFHFGFDTTSQ